VIDLETAIETIVTNVTVLEAEDVALDDIAGRTLARDIVSSIDVSGFRNSAMDGFAVRAELIQRCSTDSPITLPVAGVAYAGESAAPQSSSNPDNCALKIMTGAPVSESYNAVVKVEDVTFTDSSVTFTAPTRVGANIRPSGEDIGKGETVFSAGHRMLGLEIGIVASMGISHASVIRRPLVSVFTTGDELVEPGGQIEFGQIYNSNRYTIAALIQPFCERVKHSSPIGDTVSSLREALNCDSEIIITSGGVSAGDKDLIPAVAAELGWKEMFHKIAIKPGKPVFFAKRAGQLLFGLPGNPLSTAVTCATLVIPALKKMSGLANYCPKTTPATLRSESRAGNRLLLWPGSISREGTEVFAVYSAKKSSASLSALSQSDGLIIERQQSSKSASGSKVEVLFWSDLLE
jgi:molybdopterin molybdotransferase